MNCCKLAHNCPNELLSLAPSSSFEFAYNKRGILTAGYDYTWTYEQAQSPLSSTREQRASRRATRSGREAHSVGTLFSPLARVLHKRLLRGLVLPGPRFFAIFAGLLVCWERRGLHKSPNTLFPRGYSCTGTGQGLVDMHVTKTNLDIIRVRQKHGQSVYPQAPPGCRWQTIFKSCTEGFINKHCFVITGSFVLCESKHIQFFGFSLFSRPV